MLLLAGGSMVWACGTWLWSEAAPPPAVAAMSLPVPSLEPLVAFEPSPEVSRLPAPEPITEPELNTDEFSRRLRDRVSELGSLSLGRANRGSLFNGVELVDGPYWKVVEPEYAYGTEVTVLAVQRAITEVNRLYPDSPRLYVGHISRKRGGWLRPHKSHQSGRDVDLGLYTLDGSRWYQKATPETLDAPRMWALLSAMHKASPLEYAFLDRRLLPILRDEAIAVGEPLALVHEMFDGDASAKPILRHARGHDDHLHVRFLSRSAVERGQRAAGMIGKTGARSGNVVAALELRARKQRTP